MKNNLINITVLSLIIFLFSGCEAIEGIFKAGVWSGVIIVVFVVAIIVLIIGKIGKGKS